MLPTIATGNVASAIGGGYEVANSCRFNDDDSAYMHITPGSTGVEEKFTFSFWMKFNHLAGSNICVLYVEGDTTGDYIEVALKPQLDIQYNNGTYSRYVTNRLFRDTNAWYHIVIAVDTTQSVAANRHKLYVNGTLETSFSTETQIPQNDVLQANTSGKKMWFGALWNGPTNFFDGYMAEVVWIDGTQYAASDFGEFDEDSPTIWKPKDVSTLTFGTNGFYLDFEDSANLGNNAGSGAADLTEVNLAATDQATDTPTNNFCTFNALDNYWPSATFSEGNMQVQTNGSAYTYTTSTFGVSTGKWYWEVEYDAKSGGSDWALVGITSNQSENNNSNWLGENQYDYAYYGLTGVYYTNNGLTSYGNTFAPGDIVGVALNLDDNELKFYKNGTVQNSGTAISITAAASTPLGVYIPAICFFDATYNGTFKGNFGGSPAFTVSSGNADGNGYGNFEYAVPSGYLALCTKNLGSDGG